MLDLSRALSLVQLHDGALGDHGHDARDAELGRFLHHPVHALAARNALREGQIQPRFALDVPMLLHLDLHGIPAQTGDSRAVLAAVPVEQA